jgi:hypothetical protein
MQCTVVSSSTAALLLLLAIINHVDVSSLVYPSPSIIKRNLLYSTHHRSPLTYIRNNMSSQLMLSQDADEPSATSASVKSPSKRAQRKAAQRTKKQHEQKRSISNKATSQHPEAIVKRLKQKQPPQPRKNNRRKHNFAERAQFLLESEKKDDEFDTTLDGLRDNQLTNINIHPVENPYEHNNDEDGGEPVIHPLHSTNVDKLDVLSTTADEVVKAIKRAQNLHDLHDIREIAHFLLEDVGEYMI